MNSCLYECTVMHQRLAPVAHRFTTRLFQFYLDLDELGELQDRFWMIGHRQRRLYEFRDYDHLWLGYQNLRDNLTAYLQTQNLHEPIGRIQLLTHLRTFGHIFNPVSFYFCQRPDGSPLCAVAEVHNTYGELKPYFLAPTTWNGRCYNHAQEKYFYISPFSEIDTRLQMRLGIPGRTVSISIDSHKTNGTHFRSSLTGTRRELTEARLWLDTLRFPAVTLKVVFLIHWHALRLYWKKAPWWRKSALTAQTTGILAKAPQSQP